MHPDHDRPGRAGRSGYNPGPMSLAPKTLLIVDDEVSNLESLERIFVRFPASPGGTFAAGGGAAGAPESGYGTSGLTVLLARDGKEALELVR